MVSCSNEKRVRSVTTAISFALGTVFAHAGEARASAGRAGTVREMGGSVALASPMPHRRSMDISFEEIVDGVFHRAFKLPTFDSAGLDHATCGKPQSLKEVSSERPLRGPRPLRVHRGRVPLSSMTPLGYRPGASAKASAFSGLGWRASLSGSVRVKAETSDQSKDAAGKEIAGGAEAAEAVKTGEEEEVNVRSIASTLLSQRSSNEEKMKVFEPFRELRQNSSTAYARVLDEILCLVDSVKDNPLCRVRLPLPLPSLRLKLGSLGRLLDFITEGSSDPLRRKRGLLIIFSELCRTRGGIRALEQQALSKAGQQVGMDEMLKRTPEGLETPNYTVVEERKEAMSGTPWEVRNYDNFTVCSVATDLNGEGAKVKGAPSFNTLARYIFGSNKQEEKMAMTTPVIMSAQNDRMSFVMPSRFWRDGSLAGAPTPMEGTGVVLEKAPAMVQSGINTFAVLWFGGYCVGSIGENLVTEKKAKLLAMIAADEHLALAGEPFLMQYNDPFVVPWKRRNEVAVAVTMKS